MGKKKRYSWEQVPRHLHNELKKSANAQKDFWATPGSSSANLNKAIMVDTWIVRCAGCGTFIIENTMENSDKQRGKNGYKCCECNDYKNRTVSGNIITREDQQRLEQYHETKRRQNGITLDDIFDDYSEPERRKGFWGSIFG